MKNQILKALLWKEWRRSWWLVVLAVALPVVAPFLLPERTNDFKMIAFYFGVFGAYFVALLAIGSSAFAAESADGTAKFLAERPVERRIMWKSKALLPLAILVPSIPLMICVIRISYGHRLLGPGFYGTTSMFTSAALCSIAASMLCGVLIDRAITAFAMGGIVTLAVVLAPLIALGGWYESMREAGKVTYNFNALLSIIGISCGLLMPAALVLLSRYIYVRQSD